jgi:gluconokinase
MPGGDAGSFDGPWVLVLDVGSSSVRCWLFDSAARGCDPGRGSRVHYSWDETDGAMAIDANRLIEAVSRTIDAAVTHARTARLEIAGVAVTTFWHSVLGLDDAGDAATELTGWGDARAAGAAEGIARRADASKLHQRTGCFIHPSYPLVRIAARRAADRERFERVSAWVSFGEYLEQHLFGERRCSLSMASGSGLLNVHSLEWDDEALEIAGITARSLSPLVDADASLAGLRQPYAGRWPELASIPWYPALGDGACANLGSGAVGPERLGITIGTTAAVRVLVEPRQHFQIPEDLWAYRLDRKRWVVGGALSNGGNALRFLSGNLELPPGASWDEILEASGTDDHGLTVLPFLVAERDPRSGFDTGGAVFGLRLDTTPEQIARAWLEAIGYRIATLCERLETHFGARGEPRASGGALHGSHRWSQMLSDILGRSIVLPAEREETSRGAAIMALASLGAIPADNFSAPRAAAEFRPDEEQNARHMRAMRRHRDLENRYPGAVSF